MAATAKKPAPAKPALKLVPPAIADAAKAISDAALQSAPMTSRAVAVRNGIQMRANDLSREREDYEDRKTLLSQQYESAMKGLDENIADIDAAMLLLNGGIAQKAAE